jgi:phosphate transport system substrate-binding protein
MSHRSFGRLALGTAALLIALACGTAQSADLVRVGGTGMALGALRALGERFAASEPSLTVEVLPSLGTPGGIKAMLAGEIDIALTARALTAAESAAGAREANCMTTALVFATSHPTASTISRRRLSTVYAEAAPKWDDGAPLKVILRSRASSEMPLLVKSFPELEAPFESAYKRPGMPVGTTDQENAEIAERTVGSLAIITLLQLKAERVRLRTLSLDGVMPAAETIADRTYPLPLRVCLVVTARPNDATSRFIDFISSAPGQALLRASGAEPSS